MVDGETKHPPLLTEADLIGLMERHGIGKSEKLDLQSTFHTFSMVLLGSLTGLGFESKLSNVFQC